MCRHCLPGIVILLLYIKAAHTQQPNSLNSQQTISQFQGNLNNPNQFLVPNSYQNGPQSQVNFQELLNSVNTESKKNTVPQMNFQRVDYQQNSPAPNQQILQGNAANANLPSLPSQMSPLSSAPNYYTPKISSGQSIYLGQNSGSNSDSSTVFSPSSKLSGVQNQPIYSFVSSAPQNTISQKTLQQNIAKQNQLLESSNPSMNCQQNSRPMNLIAGEPIITSIQYEPALSTRIANSPEGNQLTLSSMRFEAAGPSVQGVPVASSVVQQTANRMQFQPTITVSQNSPSFISPQFQPAVNPVLSNPSSMNQALVGSFLNEPTLRSVQVQPVVETKPEITSQIQAALPPIQSTLMSYLLSQLDSSKTPKYSNTVGPKQKSKSSLKALLPLILDMLQERQPGCGCHNCGYVNNNNNEVTIEEPKVFGGYSNQKVYGPNDVIPIPNNKDSINDLFNDSRNNALQKNLRQNVVNTGSAEESDEDDSDYTDDD